MAIKTYIAHSALSHARSHKYVTKVFKNGRWRYVYGKNQRESWTTTKENRRSAMNNMYNLREDERAPAKITTPNGSVIDGYTANEKGRKRLESFNRVARYGRSNKSIPAYAKQQHREIWALRSGASKKIKGKKGRSIKNQVEA